MANLSQALKAVMGACAVVMSMSACANQVTVLGRVALPPPADAREMFQRVRAFHESGRVETQEQFRNHFGLTESSRTISGYIQGGFSYSYDITPTIDHVRPRANIKDLSVNLIHENPSNCVQSSLFESLVNFNPSFYIPISGSGLESRTTSMDRLSSSYSYIYFSRRPECAIGIRSVAVIRQEEM